MKKNIKLLFILALLIAISATIALVDTNSKTENFQADQFQVLDSAMIQSISIKRDGLENLIERKKASWLLNNQYATDANMVKILKTIISQVQIKRAVSKLNNIEIIKDLEESGNAISISLSDGSKITYTSGGNASKSTSYFANTETNIAYVVEIPGYNNYISGIFELTENQWRDRVLFSTSWRTLKELKIDYLNQTDLQIAFENRFLKVEGVKQMDTTALLSYLQQYEFFQINDYLVKGNYPKYDSLLATEPFVSISISDIDKKKSKKLSVFPKMKGEQFYLLTDESKQMMVVDQKRMESILVSYQQFSK